MQLRGKSRERSSPRKVTPPSPTYMSNDQFASYLTNLRGNRVARPGGARPPPPSLRSSRPDSADPFTTSTTTSNRQSVAGTSILSEMSSPMRPNSDMARPRGSRPSYAGSIVSRYTTNTMSGKDYYPEKPTEPPLKPSDVVPTATYMERGQRWMEKEEAFDLHQAMDHMDILDLNKEAAQDEQPEDDDSRLYDAALNEAAELVWQHQHGVKPPEPGAPYRYKPHLRKDSYAHARAASIGRYGEEVSPTGLARDSIRSFSPSSSGSDRTSSPGSGRESLDQPRSGSASTTPPVVKSKTYSGIASGSRITSNGRRRSSMKRNISGEIEKPFSGDQIWEEPEGSTISERKSKESDIAGLSQSLRIKTKNLPSRVQFAPETAPESPASSPEASSPTKPWQRYEIHRNPPTQSRNPLYTTNNPSKAPQKPPQEIPTKNGMEIRGDDIRQATSMRLKDRSVKLPTPSAVSDSPGRPIVSFDKNWKAPEEATDSKPDESSRVPIGINKERAGQNSQSPVPNVSSTPDIQISAPPSRSFGKQDTPSISINGKGGASDIPTISVSGDSPAVPTIMLPDDNNNNSNNHNINNKSNHRSTPSVPVIVTPDSERRASTRPLPDPSTRPLPDPKTAQSKYRHDLDGRRRSHWSPAPGASPRATAICADCQLPIEGRFVALKGSPDRFHPHCFRCYACGTALEALEISPEPDSFRAERLDRIRRRAAGEVLPEEPGKTMAEDGDERHRFYCHLDWHEQFAPRCKHCRTPILGEHVVALGAHWHYGHFFCAECGDPFEQGMTHIEKDGYAWCVNCQTKRTERRAPKCKGCRKAVIGQYVRALGAEWHEECFRCGTCGGGFDDGQIFPMRDRGAEVVVLCTGCRARELKM
ncbi:hypothetical protein F4810DRAFT_722168 [Camillea tinctor]|nr:hypothetical protein F4810DRAFT_722168 [Camillea tinctor]